MVLQVTHIYGQCKAMSLLILALSVGCVAIADQTPNRVEVRPGQSEAADMIWHEMMGMDGAPPTVHWIDGVPCKTITDHLVLGINMTYPDGHMICAAGFELNHEVTLLRQADSIADAGMDHEFMHAFMEDIYSDGDAYHTREQWKAIPEMRAQLKAAGF